MKENTLYYLLREQDCLTILKFLHHPDFTKSTLIPEQFSQNIPPWLLNRSGWITVFRLVTHNSLIFKWILWVNKLSTDGTMYLLLWTRVLVLFFPVFPCLIGTENSSTGLQYCYALSLYILLTQLFWENLPPCLLNTSCSLNYFGRIFPLVHLLHPVLLIDSTD